MANETRRIKPDVLTKDDTDFAALKKITGYAPPNPAFTIAAIQANKDASTDVKERLAQAEALVKTLRDEDVAADGNITIRWTAAEIRSRRSSATTRTRFKKSGEKRNPSINRGRRNRLPAKIHKRCENQKRRVIRYESRAFFILIVL